MKSQKKKQKQKSNVFTTIILVVLAFMFLITPLLVRSLEGNNALIDEESYVHLGFAQNINGANFPLQSNNYSSFDYFVALLLLITESPLLVGKIFPLLLGIASLLMLRLKLDDVIVFEQERALVVLLFIISPLFIITFTSLNPYAFMLFLALLSWKLFDKYKWASMIVLVSILTIDVKSFVVVAALLVAYALRKGDTWKLPALVGGGGLLLAMIVESITGYIPLDPLLTNTSLNALLSSFGSDVGYSLFICILALIGGVSLWERKRESILTGIIIIIVMFFSMQELSARVMLLPVLAIIACRGLLVLFDREWSVKELKEFTIFVICLAMLFTLILTITSRVNDEPDLAMMDALLFLQSAPDNDLVLSSQDNGVLISRIARQPSFLDNLRHESSLTNERLSVAEEIFSSQRMAKTGYLLEEQGITHILIDRDMRNGAVWTADEQGLLFLVKYSPRLVLVYQNEKIEIYRYVAS